MLLQPRSNCFWDSDSVCHPCLPDPDYLQILVEVWPENMFPGLFPGVGCFSLSEGGLETQPPLDSWYLRRTTLLTKVVATLPIDKNISACHVEEICYVSDHM